MCDFLYMCNILRVEYSLHVIVILKILNFNEINFDTYENHSHYLIEFIFK